MEISVDGPLDGDDRWSIAVPEGARAEDVAGPLTDAVDDLDGGSIQLWIRGVDDGHDERALDDLATTLGFRAYRDLWQLRCPLPTAPSELATRSFTPDDIEEFVAVNNRAFSWHPEQSGLTRAEVEAKMAEPWFDADGFRLHHIDGDLAAFCWTKIHADETPPLGEIYVIAVDPAHHGDGLGAPMTLAGLDWLAGQGLEHGMLYVESDNAPANATYDRIGFTRHHTDRAYRLERS